MSEQQPERLGNFAKSEVLRALATPVIPQGVDFEPIDAWLTSRTHLRTLLRVTDGRRSLPTQIWMVTIPIDREEWERLNHWDTLHTIFRVQLEDWWATHEREEASRAMGLRLDAPQG